MKKILLSISLIFISSVAMAGEDMYREATNRFYVSTKTISTAQLMVQVYNPSTSDKNLYFDHIDFNSNAASYYVVYSTPSNTSFTQSGSSTALTAVGASIGDGNSTVSQVIISTSVSAYIGAAMLSGAVGVAVSQVELLCGNTIRLKPGNALAFVRTADNVLTTLNLSWKESYK